MFTEKLCVINKMCRMTKENMWHWSLVSPCMHTCVCTHEHAPPPLPSKTGARISNGKLFRVQTSDRLSWERELAMVSQARQTLRDSKLLSVDTQAHAARDLSRGICHLLFQSKPRMEGIPNCSWILKWTNKLMESYNWIAYCRTN